MRIDVNQLRFSKESDIATKLKNPLFKLVSNIAIAAEGKPNEHAALRIAKVALHCFIAALCIIPVGFASLLGKAISHFSKTKIDYEGLSKAPPPVELPQELESDSSIDIMSLSNRLNALKAPIAKQECLQRLCTWTIEENDNIYPNEPEKRQLFCKQLSLYLKGIVKKLDSGEVSKDKEKDLLTELADAATRCYPTWLEEAAKLYSEIHGQAGTAEVKLLKYVQEYKESVILQFVQKDANFQWHSLNYVRNILGKELGLNTTLNQLDPYVANDSKFGKNLTKWLFLQKYENVNTLITSVQDNINKQNYDQSLYDLLIKACEQKGVENPQDYVATNFYDEDYKIKAEGVNLMLRFIGVLRS